MPQFNSSFVTSSVNDMQAATESQPLQMNASPQKHHKHIIQSFPLEAVGGAGREVRESAIIQPTNQAAREPALLKPSERNQTELSQSAPSPPANPAVPLPDRTRSTMTS